VAEGGIHVGCEAGVDIHPCLIKGPSDS
jgi:hypothetical protein